MLWLPRLALYSGARIEELAQLRAEDVREINGVMCLDFVYRPEDPLPTFLKGKLGSERQVPIHPWLKEQGFLKFCNGRAGRLFKEMDRQRQPWASQPLISFVDCLCG